MFNFSFIVIFSNWLLNYMKVQSLCTEDLLLDQTSWPFHKTQATYCRVKARPTLSAQGPPHQSKARLIKATPASLTQGLPHQNKAYLVEARPTSLKQMFLILSLISITTQTFNELKDFKSGVKRLRHQAATLSHLTCWIWHQHISDNTEQLANHTITDLQ